MHVVILIIYFLFEFFEQIIQPCLHYPLPGLKKRDFFMPLAVNIIQYYNKHSCHYFKTFMPVARGDSYELSDRSFCGSSLHLKAACKFPVEVALMFGLILTKCFESKRPSNSVTVIKFYPDVGCLYTTLLEQI